MRSIGCCSSSRSGWRSCLYDPEDCESERTVIISELQGGENDPDQLLDQELTATAFKAHPYRHPTIGWLSDLQTMTRDDLYGYYRRHYMPNNATLVIVGDVDTEDALRRSSGGLGRFAAGPRPDAHPHREPEQTGERRVTIRKEGTTAYLRVGVSCARRRPIRCLSRPGARCRVDRRKGREPVVAVFVSRRRSGARVCIARSSRTGSRRPSAGAMLPTEEPFLYTVSATATDGVSLGAVETALIEELERVRLRRHHRRRTRSRQGATARATGLRRRQHHQHRAPDRLLRNDRAAGICSSSCRARIRAVTLEGVATIAARMLTASNRTIGWFDPLSA